MKSVLRTMALAATTSALAMMAAPAMAQSALETEMQSRWDNGLEELFIHFHRNPELSFREFETAKRMAEELRATGAEVTEGVGGTGVVAVMRNGEGPTVLLRADMDGLPVKEDSGLPYASTATQEDIDGIVKPVMHACGHDTHITGLVATAHALAARKDEWSGTAVLIVQPAEERIGGAKAMMEDGLYERFPKPDVALAWHVSSFLPAGHVVIAPGIAYSSSDSIDITVPGIGAHGAAPHTGRDPVLIASHIVVALQALVAREIDPLQPGVVTVGSFQSGFRHNVISDEAKLLLTVRSDSNAVRETLLAGIERIALNVGRAMGLPEDNLPVVRVGSASTPVTVNDRAMASRVRAAFVEAFGEDSIVTIPRQGMGAEDFAYFVAPDTDVPGVYFGVGGTPLTALTAAREGGPPVPSHHSPLFKVDGEAAVVTGAAAMTAAALELLQPE